MIKNIIPYNSFNLLYILRHWIAFCFILFLVAKPIINIATLLVETKYELPENLLQENTGEKEDITGEDDNKKVHNSIVFNTSIYPKQLLSYFGIQEYFLNFKPDIHLPPPRL